jgi:hypothetical protein
VEEEVDELGDFDVVDGYLWLQRGGDDQVLLFRPYAELKVPRGNAVDIAS